MPLISSITPVIEKFRLTFSLLITVVNVIPYFAVFYFAGIRLCSQVNFRPWRFEVYIQSSKLGYKEGPSI